VWGCTDKVTPSKQNNTFLEMTMKTASPANTANLKDSIGAIAIIGCILATAIATIASSQHAADLKPLPVYKMDVIEVTAPRIQVQKMPTIVVTASRVYSTMVAASSPVNVAF
jgi:hypothetical protein